MNQNPFQLSLRKILKGASIYSLSEVLVKASGFLLIPLYTRILTTEDYGIVGYLQVMLQIATVVLGFGMYSAQTRYLYEKNASQSEIKQFIFNINLVSAVAGILMVFLVTAVALLTNWTVSSGNISAYPYLVFTSSTALFQILANNASNYYRAQQKFVITSVMNFGRFLLVTVFSIVLVVRYDLGALGRIGGLFAGSMLFTLIAYPFYAKNFKPVISIKHIKFAVLFSAPTVIHLLSATIHEAVDRLVLDRFVSLSDIGIYTLAFSIGNVINIFIASFNKAYQPAFFQQMNSSDENRNAPVIRTFRIWLLMVTGIALIGILLGGPFLRVFAGPRFVATIKLFPWVILAMYLGGFYYFFVSPIFFFKKTKFLPAITMVSAALNIGLNFLLIPKLGIKGAAIATAISHTVQSGLAHYFGQRLYKIHWPWLQIAGSVAVVFLSVYISLVYL